MRSEKEMYEFILRIAREDERIRALPKDAVAVCDLQKVREAYLASPFNSIFLLYICSSARFIVSRKLVSFEESKHA